MTIQARLVALSLAASSVLVVACSDGPEHVDRRVARRACGVVLNLHLKPAPLPNSQDDETLLRGLQNAEDLAARARHVGLQIAIASAETAQKNLDALRTSTNTGPDYLPLRDAKADALVAMCHQL